MSKAGMSSAAKRIQKELAEISLEPPTNCSAGPKGDNLYEWVSTILGPPGTCTFFFFFFVFFFSFFFSPTRFFLLLQNTSKIHRLAV
jgi:ubiquitin-conjugating enzyme E2 D/E